MDDRGGPAFQSSPSPWRRFHQPTDLGAHGLSVLAGLDPGPLSGFSTSPTSICVLLHPPPARDDTEVWDEDLNEDSPRPQAFAAHRRRVRRVLKDSAQIRTHAAQAEDSGVQKLDEAIRSFRDPNSEHLLWSAVNAHTSRTSSVGREC